jgi:hypothetical protein
MSSWLRATAWAAIPWTTSSPSRAGPQFTKDFWQAEVTKMIKVYGAPIDDSDASKIVDYLAQRRIDERADPPVLTAGRHAPRIQPISGRESFDKRPLQGDVCRLASTCRVLTRPGQVGIGFLD